MLKQEVTEVQKQFLARIEDIIPRGTSLVMELSDLLEISTDSAYRRMRGETPLSIDEIIKLCSHFNVSFDAFSKTETGMVTFRYSNPEPVEESFNTYLAGLESDLELISRNPGSRIMYAAEDVPVFFHYGFSEIASFKLFYWLKSVMNIPSLEGSSYDPSLVPKTMTDSAKRIYDLYTGINSVEIWTENTVMSTVKQITYYWESGIFRSKEEALSVCDSFREELTSIRKMAEVSSKRPDETGRKNYEFYFSEIEITNNCVLVDLGSVKSVYLGHFSFFTMTTLNEAYCRKTEDWLNNIIRKSIPISGVSEKHRHLFFNKALKSLEELRERIAGN